MAGTPSSALRAPRTRSATTTGGGWALVLLVSGVVMIVGSIGSWLTISTFSVSDSAGGTSHGGEGWISLVAGIVLIVVGLLGIVAGGNGLRVVGLMGAVASGAGLGISIYFCERFLSAPGSGVGHLGWGLILVLLTSLVSLVAAVLVTLAAD